MHACLMRKNEEKKKKVSRGGGLRKKKRSNSKAKKKKSRLSLLAPVVGPARRRHPLEVLLRPGHVRLDRLGPGLPAGGAHLAVLVGELEGLDEPQRLVDAAADGEVVDGDLSQDAGGRDDEEAAEGDAGVVSLVCGVVGWLEGGGERKGRRRERGEKA